MVCARFWVVVPEHVWTTHWGESQSWSERVKHFGPNLHTVLILSQVQAPLRQRESLLVNLHTSFSYIMKCFGSILKTVSPTLIAFLEEFLSSTLTVREKKTAVL